MTVSLRLLGPGSWRGEPITSSRSRVLLALLAGAPAGLTTERLAGEVWPDGAPANPAKAIQVLVSRARSALGADTIESTPTGYRLAVPAEEVDVRYAAHLASRATARLADHDAQGALADASEGLGLWDAGPADPDVVDALQGSALDLAATSRTLRRTRALALAALGRSADALPELVVVLDESPDDDVVRVAMLRAQAAVVGRASALELYETYRRELRDRLGMTPSPALLEVQEELLAEDAPVRHGIRLSPNPLLGRAADLAALRAMIATSRVTSIIGPGGLGKTRLAQQLAAEATQTAVHVVELAGVATGEGVLPEVASVVGARDSSPRRQGPQSPIPTGVLAQVAEQLSSVPTLLVLDNCEHVLDAVADLVDELVSTSPRLRVLTTSRIPLDIAAEAVYLLPQLDAPTAVDLFTERAQAVRPGVDLPPEVVGRICEQLDGLPLAIELAAAKLRVMTATEVERRLDNRLALLRGTSRSAPERHQTLLAVIDWSWNLLGETERAALRLLSVFQDGFTLQAATAVLGPGAETDVTGLVTQSLLGMSETPLGARFRMLETVREFAGMQLIDAGEDAAAEERMRRWAGAFARGRAELFMGPGQPQAMTEVRSEEANLVTALRSASGAGDGDVAAATFAALSLLWSIESNHFRVVRTAPLVERLLYRHDPSPEYREIFRLALALLTLNAAFIRPRAGARALSRMRRLGPGPAGEFAAVVAEVIQVVLLGRPDDAATIAAVGVRHGAIGRTVADAAAAMVAENAGHLAESLRYAETALAAAEEVGDVWSLAGAHQRVAELAIEMGDYASVEQHAVAAIEGLQRLGAGPDVVQLRGLRALAALRQGRIEDAERLLATARHGVPERTDLDDGFPFEMGTDTLRAEVHIASGRVEEGLATYRTAVERLGSAPNPMDPGASWAGFEPWLLYLTATTVAAHALHGAGRLVEDMVPDLAQRTDTLLRQPMSSFLDYPVTGSLLYALGLWALLTPDASGDVPQDRARSGARLMATGVAFGHSRSAPSLSQETGRDRALAVVGAAYDQWVTALSAQDREGVREEALGLLTDAFGDVIRPGAAS